MVAHAYAKLFSKYIAIMKKKLYNQPEIIVSQVEPMMLMQDVSVLAGPPVKPTDPPAWGD